MFKKIILNSEIKLAISAALESGQILAALVAALSIFNSSGASPGATEKVVALVARATCSGAIVTALSTVCSIC